MFNNNIHYYININNKSFYYYLEIESMNNYISSFFSLKSFQILNSNLVHFSMGQGRKDTLIQLFQQ
jgi:hypothetical protein